MVFLRWTMRLGQARARKIPPPATVGEVSRQVDWRLTQRTGRRTLATLMNSRQDPVAGGGDDPLAMSDLRFRTLFERAPFSVQLLAADGRTLEVNRAWEALWQVSDGDGVKKYVLEEYNILSDPQLEAKGVAPVLRQAFAGT